MKKIYGILGLLLFLWIFLAINTANPWYNIFQSTFLSPNNIENLLSRTAMHGLLAIGVAFVIIHSGIDLSIGSVVCLSAALLAIFLHVDYLPFDSVPVAEVKAGSQEVRVVDDSLALEPNQVVMFQGAAGGKAVYLTIADLSSSADSRTITLDKHLGGDHKQGRLLPTVPVLDFVRHSDQQEPDTITLAGEHERLEARDMLSLYHVTEGKRDLSIEKVTFANGNTVVQLRNPLSAKFAADRHAVLIERRQRMPIVVAVGAVLGIGLLLGLCHGLLITKLELQPFVVTLCGLLIYRGVARWLVNDQPPGFGTEYDNSLRVVAIGNRWLWRTVGPEGEMTHVFGIPYPFMIFVAVAIAAAIFLNQTIWGRYLLALGRNEDAARYSGINTSRIVIAAYMICTVLAVTGGMLFGLNANVVSPSSFGSFYELYAIAAAVLGGCSLRGGEGSIVGVMIGAAVMQTLYNMIVLMKISPTLEFTIIGAVLLIGVIADEMFKKIGAKRRAMAQAKALQS